MKFKQIFWDNDGVLVDTEHYYLQASREALATVNISLSEEEFAEISLNRGQSIFELAQGTGVAEREIKDLRAWRNNRYAALLEENSLAVEGAAETLKSLHGQVRMAIVTSSLKNHFEIIHGKTGFLDYMDFYLTREDYKASKPSAEAYLLALQRSGQDPADVLVIEDTPRGLAAAKAAGLTCWAVPNRYTALQHFREADEILTSIRDIPAYIL